MKKQLSREAFENLCAKERAGLCTAGELAALEPYRVKRAVFLAAGFGSRMRPITLNTPKPLVRVHGKRLIDGLIDAVLAAGIEEIIVVCGYLAEEFIVLKEKYPMIRLIENPLYAETNNISSAVAVKELLAGAYLCEADWLLRNPAVFRKYEYETHALGYPQEHCEDWCFTVEDGRILSHHKGGEGCWMQIGISFWDEEDGTRLGRQLQEVFESLPGGRDLFWEKVPLELKRDDYRVGIRECSPEDVVEIDSFAELQALDEAYLL